MVLQESGEMYLETILRLTLRGKHVRAIDVGEELGYSKPSVSRAMGLLRAGGYIEVSAEGFITLTEAGHAAADRIYERHTTLSAFLKRMGVSEQTAVEDACRMEHVISEESFAAIKRAMEQKRT